MVFGRIAPSTSIYTAKLRIAKFICVYLVVATTWITVVIVDRQFVAILQNHTSNCLNGLFDSLMLVPQHRFSQRGRHSRVSRHSGHIVGGDPTIMQVKLGSNQLRAEFVGTRTVATSQTPASQKRQSLCQGPQIVQTTCSLRLSTAGRLLTIVWFCSEQSPCHR